MKNISLLLVILFLFSCKTESPQVIKTDDYELIIPNNPKAILILFPGLGGNANLIKQESKIPKEAIENQIAVLLFNSYNHHLFLYSDEKHDLEELISNTLKTHHLENKNIFLGGFSSGGNVALLSTDNLNAKGVFIIDSPLDLANLYLTSEKKLQNCIDEKVNSEPQYLVNLLNKALGNPNEDISHYENYSPYTSTTNFIYNINFSKDTAIRLFTEPDLDFYQKWCSEIKFSDLNAFSIQKMYNSLLKLGYKNIEYIETQNKGYRANGNRSPHSWSIVDEKEIIDWILKNN